MIAATLSEVGSKYSVNGHTQAFFVEKRKLNTPTQVSVITFKGGVLDIVKSNIRCEDGIEVKADCIQLILNVDQRTANAIGRRIICAHAKQCCDFTKLPKMSVETDI